MASQSLYRKWRSQTFGELVGQEHVVQTLRNALAEDRVAHAYLFTGPRGVGKTTMARLLAKAVNCLAPDTAARPCGQCPPCRSIAEGRAVDVIEMDAASNTSVEDARELIERVQFRPAELRIKVYILDEIHMLSTAAFNALLKTLEEPPDHAIFVMATTEVHKVPATILSRCQRFTFTRHGVASTAAHLRRIAEAESLTLADGVPEAIARAATGSMRDALSVLEQLASFASGAITLDQVHSLLGMTAAAEVHALIEALLDGDTGAALRAVGGVADQGADIRQFTRDLVERLRALLLLLASGDTALADTGEDELPTMEAWAAQATVPRLLHWIKIFSGLDYQLRTTPYGHLPLELAVVEALVVPPAGPAADELRPATAHRRPTTDDRRPMTATSRPSPAAGSQGAPRRPQPTTEPPAPPRPMPSAELASDGHRQPLADLRSAPVAGDPGPPTTEPLSAHARGEGQPLPAAEPATADAPPTTNAPPAELPALAGDPPPPEPLAADPALTVKSQGAAESLAVAFEQAAALVPPMDAAPVEADSSAPTSALSVAESRGAPRSPELAAAANADFSVLEQVEALWEEIKRDVRPKSPTVQALLHSIRPIDVEGNTVVLLASSPFHKENLEKPQNRRIVEDVIKKHLGGPFAIRCTIEARTEARDLRGQIREARKDDLVRAAMNIFEAHIVDIEPDE